MVDSLYIIMAVRRGLVPLLVFDAGCYCVCRTRTASEHHFDHARHDSSGSHGISRLRSRADTEPGRGSKQECGF